MIEGNLTAILKQIKGDKFNSIGEREIEYDIIATLKNGFLDLINGDSKRTIYNTKIQESTHVFICDYKDISTQSEGCIAVIDNDIYDVTLIDDPMKLHEHLEIYMKYVGGQNVNSIH